jgi:MFS family permease
MLALLAAGQLLGMSVWLAASAVAPELSARWGLDAGRAGWLTSAVQLGFVAGTVSAAVLNLADILPARSYVAAACWGAALSNAAVLLAPGLAPAVAARFATGACCAAVYPPAMKMAATWFRSERGLAIGIVVGALTVGKALPYLADALGGADYRVVIWATSGAAVLAGALVAAGYRDGPFAFDRRPFAWSLVRDVVHSRRWRLTTSGYCGHMLELYACWTWLGAYLAASAGVSGGVPERAIALSVFAAIGVGGGACVWGGWAADRIGRERLVTTAMAASGACAAGIGLLYGGSYWALLLVACVWGWFVIADSAQFSTMVTESVPAHAVGTALTLQTSIGFALTTVTIQLVPWLAERAGWRWSLAVLAAGPMIGIAAIRRLGRAEGRMIERRMQNAERRTGEQPQSPGEGEPAT